jgi:hypothetical protein
MNTKEQLTRGNLMRETPSHPSFWFFYAVRQTWRVKRTTLYRKVRTIAEDKASTPICPRCGNDVHETIVQEPYPN